MGATALNGKFWGFRPVQRPPGTPTSSSSWPRVVARRTRPSSISRRRPCSTKSVPPRPPSPAPATSPARAQPAPRLRHVCAALTSRDHPPKESWYASIYTFSGSILYTPVLSTARTWRPAGWRRSLMAFLAEKIASLGTAGPFRARHLMHAHAHRTHHKIISVDRWDAALGTAALSWDAAVGHP
jgi:hypothetical protein